MKKEGPVTAGDIQADETVEIVNKDLVICTLSKDRPFKMEIEIGRGRGSGVARHPADVWDR